MMYQNKYILFLKNVYRRKYNQLSSKAQSQ